MVFSCKLMVYLLILYERRKISSDAKKMHIMVSNYKSPFYLVLLMADKELERSCYCFKVYSMDGKM